MLSPLNKKPGHDDPALEAAAMSGIFEACI